MTPLMRMYQKQVKGYSPTREFTKELEGNMRKFRVTLHIDDIEIKTTERSQDMKTLVNEHHDLWQHFDFVSIEEVKA